MTFKRPSLRSLSDGTVLSIKEWIVEGRPDSQIADDVSAALGRPVNKSIIWQIRRGISYRDVPWPEDTDQKALLAPRERGNPTWKKN